jgi:hypothetical protein
MAKLSKNKKIFLLYLLVFVALVALTPSDLVDTYAFFFGMAFFPFLLHLIAQRGVRVGFKYWPTFIYAWLFLPLTAFVVWIVRRPIKSD